MAQGFTDESNSYNLYPNNNNTFTLAIIDKDLNIKKTAVDLSTLLPIRKPKKLNPADDVFGKAEMLDTIRSSSIVFTRRKVQFYQQPQSFSYVIASGDSL